MAKRVTVVYVLRRREGSRGKWTDVACYEEESTVHDACEVAALKAAGGDDDHVERLDALNAFGGGFTSLWVARGAEGKETFFGYFPLTFYEDEECWRERER